ncbi:MAG: SAM-dependent chlorinase/fluorinase [Bacteroidota bacterium]
MSVITLTTDLGIKDYYLATLKGFLLRSVNNYPIIDITHNIESHDIVQAAFIFKNAWHAFPESSIHLLSVKNYYGEKRRFIAFEYQKHFFVGPDNGLFSLVFPDWNQIITYELNRMVTASFPSQELFAHAVKYIHDNNTLTEIGPKVTDTVSRITFQPVLTQSEIKGSVIHIDKYENVIINISKELFYQVGNNRSFSLYFKRHDPITKMASFYHDVPVGETLCLFNSAHLLEIAVNMGKASTLLGLQIEDTIQITFHD